jgi:hypothetical protein
MSNLPTIQELHEENALVSYKNDQLNLLLNQEPKKEWVKEHPFVKGHKYIPIDKVEFMLRKIFKKYSIEITNQGTSFNGVWVTVRVHYFHPTEATMMFHDGIGAVQLQTAKGTSPADLANINNGALSMAYPIAKTLAIKDACDHFGKLFGCDLNRKDTMAFTVDQNPDNLLNELIELFEQEKDDLHYDVSNNIKRIIDNKEVKSYQKTIKYLKEL